LSAGVVDVTPTDNITLLKVLDLGTNFLNFSNTLVSKDLIGVFVVLLNLLLVVFP